MLFHTPSHQDDTPSNESVTPESAIREDGSYEIVFNGQNQNTAYSADGYNAYGFSANGSRKTPSEEKNSPPRKKKSPATVMIAISIALALFSLAFSIGSFFVLKSSADDFTLGTKPNPPATLEPWENPHVTTPTDAYAAATAKTINSVVVIDVTSQGGTSSGSGVVWAIGETYSYIVTCNHVIEDAKEIKITFHNGEVTSAELVGGDPKTDIAVLKIEKTDLTPVLLPHEDSELSIGQAVIAIGNPLGEFGNSVSDGILSSTARNILVDGSVMRVLQTTAAVNHGNSGGGLFDLNGQLIGLVNAKSAENSVEGIGFAIPYDVLKTISAELITKGYVSGRPALGITAVMIDTTAALNDALRQYPDLEDYVYSRNIFGQQVKGGLYVVDPSTGAGYAEGADELSFGDRITHIGTTQISSESDIRTALNGFAAGDTVQITFVRSNKNHITEIILGEIGK